MEIREFVDKLDDAFVSRYLREAVDKEFQIRYTDFKKLFEELKNEPITLGRYFSLAQTQFESLEKMIYKLMSYYLFFSKQIQLEASMHRATVDNEFVQIGKFIKEKIEEFLRNTYYNFQDNKNKNPMTAGKRLNSVTHIINGEFVVPDTFNFTYYRKTFDVAKQKGLI